MGFLFYQSVKIGSSCIVCGKTKTKGQSISMHHFPTDPSKRSQWLKAVNLNILGSVVGIFYMEILVVFPPFAWVNTLLHQESCS